MSNATVDRRDFLKTAVIIGGAALGSANAGHADGLHIATNEYPWMVFYQRDGRNFGSSLDSVLQGVAESGINGWEPLVLSPAQLDALVPLLKKHGLEMRSLYVNSVLHLSDEAEKSIGQVLAIAEKAKAMGTRIIVTNPSPIRWGGPENKTDEQLKVQARSMEELGGRLAAAGFRLAYHNHDIELRNAAREFHHMMVGTDPKLVFLCLDAHWIYRGSGNSSVALFDILKLYGPRVAELHLRQSRHGAWTETFGEGDIDYQALERYLEGIGVKPHLDLEQAIEQDSPKTMDVIEAHRRGRGYASRVFAGLAD